MVLVNYATKEIVAKIVYYGPGLCGKTTNLNHVYTRLRPKKRGKMISLATEEDRTLFFDFLPMELGVIQGFKVRFQLYTVPGQVFYSSTRRLVLKGADAVVFVADSQAEVMEKNLESIEDMKDNLTENGLDPFSIPMVFQYNKRDLEGVLDVAAMDSRINYRGAPYFESVATTGEGVMESFKEVTRLLITDLKRKHSLMDTDRISEIPAEVFEPEKLPEEEAQEVEYELEIGSGIQDEGGDEDVVAGSLLDQIETISLADTIQAETFLDNVREGVSAEEAKEKATKAAPVRGEKDEEVSGTHVLGAGLARRSPAPKMPPDKTGERELTPEELIDVEPFEGLQPGPGAQPPDEEDLPAYTIGESIGPRGMMSEEGPGRPAMATTRPPHVPPAPETAREAATENQISALAEGLARLENEVASLRRAVENLEIPAPFATPPKAAGQETAGILEALSEIRELLPKTAEGQDRLLLSILETARQTRKENQESAERLDDAIKYLVDILKEEKKPSKKRWL